MDNNYSLSFINQEDFENHVKGTLETYDRSLNSIDLASFNSNVIDPIKLLFDKEVFRRSFEDVISMELQRQRDKSNTNAIGYFHQNMFKYIDNCVVPDEGWDVIFEKDDKKVFVEMKNKHNTMNSSSTQKTYMRMQNQILKDSECICMLVEVIAPRSRDIEWSVSLDGTNVRNERIRRVSIDNFYKLVTGIDDAFYQICMQLPKTIKKLINDSSIRTVEEDTVIDELREKNPDTLMALYLLAFSTYEGFDKLS